MAGLPVPNAVAETPTKSFRIRLVLAFFAIYILWGTTFLAIRIAVEEMPPLFAAGVRFFIAGAALFGFLIFVKGATKPTRLQWRNIALMGLLMFVAEYAPLFWAEKFVPSGVVSVLAATIPILTIIAEALLLRHERLRPMMVAATLLGFVGVAVLVWPGAQQHFGVIPCLAVLAGSTGWALGSVLSRSLELPKARPVTAGATMMIGGAGLLLLSAAFGEMNPVPHISVRGGLALLYLIVIGSLVAFTAYMWLLAHMPATRVASYAYVNPIVAVALGYFAAGEAITPRTLAGTVLVVTSVFLTLRRGKEGNVKRA
jgi:drug/metabolite transporter (DMT)-like permease